MRLSEAIVMVSRSATATVVATNANDGLVRPQLIERLTG